MRILLYVYKYFNLENNIFELYYYNLILYVKILIYKHLNNGITIMYFISSYLSLSRY